MNTLKDFINKAFTYNMLLFFLLIIFSSCTKDTLNKVPSDRYSEAAIWNDKSLIEQFVNYTYRKMPTGNYEGASRIGVSGTDEVHGRGSGNAFIAQGLMTPSRIGALDYWTGSVNNNFNYWLPISNCNVFMKNINNATISDVAMKDRMIGEMRFLRAYSYFRLVSLFGGVPLITEPLGLNDNFFVPRNTYDECMDFVIAELEAAADLLPFSYPAEQTGRVTKGAALALKSRALLHMASPLNNPSNNIAKWQQAADAAKAVIDLNLYSLFHNYQTLFLYENSYNSEVIWARPFNYDLSREANYPELLFFPNGYGGNAQPHPFQDMVESYETKNGLLPKDDPTYDPNNQYVNRDPRFYLSILYDGAPFQHREVETFLPGGRDTKEGPIAPWNATETGYYVRKFIDESITNPGTANQGHSPWIYIRYAEILLNYAETAYFLNDEAKCREYINMVRSRSGVNMPLVTESGEALFARLQNERKIELFLEEFRWFDIRRWKIAPIVMNTPATRMDIKKDIATGEKTYTVETMYQRAFSDKDYLVPIPQSEIEKNKLLIQNPGY